MLLEWKVVESDMAKNYKALARLRNDAVHYRQGLESGVRERALSAISQLQSVIGEIFAPIGGPPRFIAGSVGNTFICREAENWPLVKEFFLPASALVSPDFRMEPRPNDSFVILDNVEYEAENDVDALDDNQFVARLGAVTTSRPSQQTPAQKPGRPTGKTITLDRKPVDQHPAGLTSRFI